MKVNDIFEREFDGKALRFQLTELAPFTVDIKALDELPEVTRTGKLPQAVLLKFALAVEKDGEFVTTEIGDNWIRRFTYDINNRINARNKSLRWLVENKDMEVGAAKNLVLKLDKKFNDWEVRYLMAIVRWAYYGEIDPNSEDDIKLVKELLSSYFVYLKEHKVVDDEKLRFANICFRITRNGERDRYLWSMKEVGWYLHSWEKKRVQNI